MADEVCAGRTIGGRYVLGEPLGSGGFGRVWRAHDPVLGVDVAVKQVLIGAGVPEAARPELLARAAREARHAARLRDSPHIVTVHDVVEEDGAPWIVMQLVDGRTLAEALRVEGPLTVDRAARVARALLRALAAAHRAGVVHRDVKPANVMLAADGGVLLADFGIAVAPTDARLTPTTLVLGSPGYLAPERWQGRGDERSDLFSLGVTLFEAVEGVLPFPSENPTAALTEEPREPERAGRLAPLLRALLVKNPGRRPTAEGALELLDGGAYTADVVPPGPAPTAVLDPAAPTAALTEDAAARTGPLKKPGTGASWQLVVSVLMIVAAVPLVGWFITVTHGGRDGLWLLGVVLGMAYLGGVMALLGTHVDSRRTVHLLAVSDQGLRHAVRRGAGGRVEFGAVPGVPDPVAVAAAGTSAGLQVVASGRDGSVHLAEFPNGGAPERFRELTEVFGRRARMVRLAAASHGGAVALVGLGSGRVFHTIRHPNGGWQAWGDATARIGPLPGITRIAVAVTSDGVTHVGAVAERGRVYHTVRRKDGSWGRWGHLNRAATGIGAAVDLAFAAQGAELQVVVARVQGGAVLGVRRPTGGWSEFTALPAGFGDRPAAGLAAVRTPVGLRVLVADPDGPVRGGTVGRGGRWGPVEQQAHVRGLSALTATTRPR